MTVVSESGAPDPVLGPSADHGEPAAPDPSREAGRPAANPSGAAHRTELEVRTPSPFVSVLITGWPMIALVLAAAYLFATLFPAIGGLLLIAVPVAVLGAMGLAARRASRIRLTVTDEVVRVSDGKTGHATDRSEVRSAVLVESLVRKRFGRRTTDLILLDRDGRCALLLSGQLWPPAVLEQVIDLLPATPLERLEGKQTPLTLAARYPKILQNSDGSHRYQPKPRTY